MNYDDEKLVLNLSNIVMIIITVIMIIILIIVSISLNKSVHREVNKLPELTTTQGRLKTTSTTIKTTKTTTTTTKKINKNSPYYDISVKSLLNDDIYSKNNLNDEEAKNVLKGLLNITNNFYCISDYSLFDSEAVLKGVKDGENDVIIYDNHKYIELYEFDEFINKFFDKRFMYNLENIKYNNNKILIEENNKYYRIENILGNIKPIFNDINITYNHEGIIKSQIRYYHSNYLDLGYTSPDYKLTDFELRYVDNRWKVDSYAYPLYE